MALCVSVAAMPLESAGWLLGFAQVSLSKIMLVAAMLALFLGALYRRPRLAVPPGTWLVIGFWLMALVVSSARWLGTSLDLPNNLIALTGYVVLVFVVWWTVRTDADVDAVVASIIAGSIPVLVVGVLEFINKGPVVANNAEHLYAGGADDLFRITSTFYDANALGRYLVFASLITLAAMSRARFKRWWPVLAGLLGVQLFCLGNSFSRGSVLAVAVAGVVYLAWRVRRSEPVAAMAFGAAGGLVAIWTLLPGMPRAFAERLFDGSSGRIAAGTRPQIAQDAARAISDNPLFGFGPDHDAAAIGRYYGSAVSAHNLYLETALVSGIPGAAMLAAYVLGHVYRLVTSDHPDDVVRARLVVLPLVGTAVGGLTLHGVKEAELWVLISLLAPLVRLGAAPVGEQVTAPSPVTSG